MNEINSIIDKFEKLNIRQQQIVSDLIEELNNQQETDTDQQIPIRRGNTDRRENHNFISSNGQPLAIGDRVQLLTTRKTGRRGELARVTKFNKLYVAIRLERNDSITQRASKYLKFIKK